MAETDSSHPDGGSPNRLIMTNMPEGVVQKPNVQNVNPQKHSTNTTQQNVSTRQPLQSPASVCFQYKKEFVKTVTGNQNLYTSSTPVSQAHPQVVYLPQQVPLAMDPRKPPLCFRQTCYEVILKSVVHVWYLIYIFAFLFGIYIYRLPAYNENLKLQIELAKIRLREEEIRSSARVREAEINRDLKVDVEKLKLGNEHTRQMESLKISQELAEKYLDSNVEVKETSSGFFSKETTTQKKTFLESSDTAAFSQLFKGYNNMLIEDNPEHLSKENIIASEDEEELVVDEIEHLQLQNEHEDL